VSESFTTAPRAKRPANIWPFTFAATPPNMFTVETRGSRGRQSRNSGWFSCGIFTQAMGRLSHAFTGADRARAPFRALGESGEDVVEGCPELSFHDQLV